MRDDRPIHVLAVAGSLRRNSYNRALLRAAEQIAPVSLQFTHYDLGEIPMFNADVEAIDDPLPVQRFKSAIRAADAILIATPEYNHGIPGVLKNALDWASRKNGGLRGKPAAIMGTTSGFLGSARAQLHLREVLRGVGSIVVARPDVLVGYAADQFDANGALVVQKTKRLIGELLNNLALLAAREEMDFGYRRLSQEDRIPGLCGAYS